MISSEIVQNKQSYLMHKSINLLQGLLIKNGKSKHDILTAIFLFFTYIKNRKLKPIVYSNSVYWKFYTFINYFTPRVNLMEITKKPKSIYIPFPPEKRNILRAQFLSHYLKLSTSSYNWRSLSKRMVIFYKNSFKKTDILNKEINFTDLTTKQNRWRTENAYKVKHKSNKKQKNVVTKGKQFYL